MLIQILIGISLFVLLLFIMRIGHLNRRVSDLEDCSTEYVTKDRLHEHIVQSIEHVLKDGKKNT